MDQLKKKQPTRLPWKSEHPYHMFDMITDTPDALKRVLTEEHSNIKKVAEVLKTKKKIYFIGIGTSLHAAQNARYYFKSMAKVECEAVNSFEFILNQPTILDSECALVIFSHTGVKTYSHQAYQIGKELGIYSVLLTSTNSIIEHEMDAIIRTSKQEQSSAYTISHSCSTLCSLLLAIETSRFTNPSLTSITEIDREIALLPNLFTDILSKSIPEIKQWCKVASQAENNYFMGYGGNESNSNEVALKIQEATYKYAQGYNLEFYLHGPFIATNSKTVSTFILTSPNNEIDKSKNQLAIERTLKSVNLVQNVNSKAALILSESDTTSLSSIGKDTITIRSPNVSEPISVLTNLYILQLMTYFLAMELKETTIPTLNPDTFKKDVPPFDTCFTNANLTL